MINEIMPQTLHVALGDNTQHEDFVKMLGAQEKYNGS